jgi:hypothetical protein
MKGYLFFHPVHPPERCQVKAYTSPWEAFTAGWGDCVAQLTSDGRVTDEPLTSRITIERVVDCQTVDMSRQIRSLAAEYALHTDDELDAPGFNGDISRCVARHIMDIPISEDLLVKAQASLLRVIHDHDIIQSPLSTCEDHRVRLLLPILCGTPCEAVQTFREILRLDLPLWRGFPTPERVNMLVFNLFDKGVGA